MRIIDAREVSPASISQQTASLLASVSEEQLKTWVEQISFPRHFQSEPEQNRATGDWICTVFQSLGYRVTTTGPYRNILAVPEGSLDEVILTGAHYDSVPGCPGADDNGSAVAALLGCASICRMVEPQLPVVFVAFNREEDDLKGSTDFVNSYLPRAPFSIRCAHILEMVGFSTDAEGSQKVPTGLPIRLSNRGNFLGLLANDNSVRQMESVLQQVGAYVPQLPVHGLNVKLGLEKFLPVLSRSDHAPFWRRAIPAVMWTDTAEFRNPNYHQASDRPETLNYTFLRQVTQLLAAAVICQGEALTREL